MEVARWIVPVCKTFPAITPMNVWDVKVFEWRGFVAQCEYEQREANRRG